MTHLGVAGGVTLPNNITIALPNGGVAAGAIQYLNTTTGNATLTGSITVQAGKFTGGAKRFGLANQGIDYAVDQYNAKILTDPVKKRAEELKSEIIAGMIIVPDYYKR